MNPHEPKATELALPHVHADDMRGFCPVCLVPEGALHLQYCSMWVPKP